MNAASASQHVSEDSASEKVPQPLRPLLGSVVIKYLPILLHLVNASIWGVLARKGLIELTTYRGAYLAGVIWANFAACFIMGMAVDSNHVWSGLVGPEYPNKDSIPLYTGITTGFCGTLSSFSSFILEIYTFTSNSSTEKFHPNGDGAKEFFSVIIAHLSVSVGGYLAGRHLIAETDIHIPAFTRKSYKFVELAMIVLGICAYIVNLVLLGVKDNGTWRLWTFSVLFSPFAVILRWYLSKVLNPKVPSFPLGTYTVNIFGTVILAILTLLTRGVLADRAHSYSNILSCHVLRGLEDGFCGTLTTVSTFVVELCALKVFHSYRYGFVSIVLSFLLALLIIGPYQIIHKSLSNPICSS
ncbi:uncharacterized protein CANTADRAFT_19204 [Suhomyces tanzawaensis NRRL Y-17324]|uniref:CRCB-domain-containing protein n=1 Tax=Suhomyces tanzawaensis NRRL Y-17324 TaxID=984487 RepID=A0A1E4SPZ9_9ASCO|nr:uncharacterized protein CANTADRAFT_19204 [Suhomyces tanzawaensis NRRL Y-17324]ODV81575.1 hypothetical protein CANTADRAFT_19204 [Suhomyces tanzawaensis NRRL Y-17324]